MHQVWCRCKASKVAAVVFPTAKFSQRRRCAEIDAPLVKIKKLNFAVVSIVKEIQRIISILFIFMNYSG